MRKIIIPFIALLCACSAAFAQSTTPTPVIGGAVSQTAAAPYGLCTGGASTQQLIVGGLQLSCQNVDATTNIGTWLPLNATVQPRWVFLGDWCIFCGALFNSTDYGASGKYVITAPAQLSAIQAYFPLTTNNNGIEGKPTGTGAFWDGAVSWGSTQPIPFSFNGSSVGYGTFFNPYLPTDVLTVNAAAGTAIAVISHENVPPPPASIAASVASGGSLAIGTIPYKITTIVSTPLGPQQSPLSAENTSCVTSSGNQICNLAVTDANQLSTGQSVRHGLWRGAAGTNNAECFVTDFTGTVFSDNGALSLTSSCTGPTAQIGIYTRLPNQANEGTNAVYGGGNGSDQTGSTANLSTTWPTSKFAVGPVFMTMLAFSNRPSLYNLGDSTDMCVGCGPYQNQTGNGPVSGSWWEKGLPAPSTRWGAVNSAMAGSTVQALAASATQNKARYFPVQFATHVSMGLAANDISNSRTAQQIATDIVTVACQIKIFGAKVFVSTAFPRTTSTDNWMTATNQTPVSIESVRVALNDIERSGFQLSGGSFVTSGGTPASCPVGPLTVPAVDAVFDRAAAVEVNSSNVLTTDGGRWLAPSAPVATLTASTGSSIGSGSTCQTSGGSSSCSQVVTTGGLTAHIYSGYVVQDVNTGETGWVYDNSTTNLIVAVNGNNDWTGFGTQLSLTIVPTNGDVLKIWPVYAKDGLHISTAGNNLVASTTSCPTGVTCGWSQFYAANVR